MGDDAASVRVRDSLLNLLANVDLILDFLERGIIRQVFEDLLNLFLRGLHGYGDSTLSVAARPHPKALPQYAFSCRSPCTSVMNRIFTSSISDQFSM